MNSQAPTPWAPIAIGGLIFLMLSLAWWLTRGARRRRGWRHAERMKAIEMGQAPPPHDPTWPRAAVCIAIGAFVPVGVFFFAWLVSLTVVGLTAKDRVGIQATVWGLSFIVSTVAIGCGTRLAFALLGSAHRPEETQAAGKPPAFDPESFEVANHRG